MGIVKGRSICDHCETRISWFDNIPLISFIFLKGKCRNCGKRISLRYPLIELATGLIFVFSGANILALLLLVVLEIIFIIDLEHQIIPDAIIFWGIAISALIFLTADVSVFPPALAGFLSAIFLLLIHLISRGRAMGLGDVKFAVLGGMVVGLKLAAIWLFLAFLTGAVAGIILILVKRAGLKDKIAFGPFLVGSIPLTVLWGEKIITLIGLR
jgi:prepilin signal peptidase PulO-like enzyme (type II secretory pathway)